MANVVKALEAARARVATLENSLVNERRSALAGLHREHGFTNVEEFLTAVKNASRSSARAVPSGRSKVAKAQPVAAAAAGAKRKGKRAKITPEIKAKVKSLVKSGRTGSQIASELSISLPSVQNIKKELGLVKARG